LRIWLRSSREADKLMAELFNGYRDVHNSRSGLAVHAAFDYVDHRLRNLARLRGFTVSEDAQIRAAVAGFERRIEAALKGGVAKLLARRYRRLRETGELVPAYSDWLVARLRACSEARDRNNPISAKQISLQTSLINQEHRPIRLHLLAGLSFRQ
jgi:hypothetical protein